MVDAGEIHSSQATWMNQDQTKAEHNNSRAGYDACVPDTTAGILYNEFQEMRKGGYNSTAAYALMHILNRPAADRLLEADVNVEHHELEPFNAHMGYRDTASIVAERWQDINQRGSNTLMLQEADHFNATTDRIKYLALDASFALYLKPDFEQHAASLTGSGEWRDIFSTQNRGELFQAVGRMAGD